MNAAPALVMRGNGAVTVGETLPQAVTLAWFLEDAARVERDVRAMGFDTRAARLDADEVAAGRSGRAESSSACGTISPERPYDLRSYLCRKHRGPGGLLDEGGRSDRLGRCADSRG